MRSSALNLAVGYISLGLAALALFAAPIWYAWRVTIQDGRAEILQADAQRLTEVFRREGAARPRQLHRHARRPADPRRAVAAAGGPSNSAAGRQSERLAGRRAAQLRQLHHQDRCRRRTAIDVAFVLRGAARRLPPAGGAGSGPLRAAGAALLVCAGRRGRHPVDLRHARRHPDPARAADAHSRHPPDRIGHHPGRPEPPAPTPIAAATNSTRCRRPSTACWSRSSS